MNKVNYSYTFYFNKILRILRLIRMFRRCIQILLLSLTSCCISWIRNSGLRIEIIFPNVGFVIYLYFFPDFPRPLSLNLILDLAESWGETYICPTWTENVWMFAPSSVHASISTSHNSNIYFHLCLFNS